MGHVAYCINKLSIYLSIYLGVKQGDPSSSLLFMMFLNDIMININTDLDGFFTINELKLFLISFSDDLISFADDQVVFTTSPIALQSMLNDFETYCILWGLNINIDKTKVLIFEKRRQTHNLQLTKMSTSCLTIKNHVIK